MALYDTIDHLISTTEIVGLETKKRMKVGMIKLGTTLFDSPKRNITIENIESLQFILGKMFGRVNFLDLGNIDYFTYDFKEEKWALAETDCSFKEFYSFSRVAFGSFMMDFYGKKRFSTKVESAPNSNSKYAFVHDRSNRLNVRGAYLSSEAHDECPAKKEIFVVRPAISSIELITAASGWTTPMIKSLMPGYF